MTVNVAVPLTTTAKNFCECLLCRCAASVRLAVCLAVGVAWAAVFAVVTLRCSGVAGVTPAGAPAGPPPPLLGGAVACVSRPPRRRAPPLADATLASLLTATFTHEE